MDLFAIVSLAVGISLAMMLAWAIQLMTHKSGWIDVIWTFAVGLGGIAAVLLPSAHSVPGRRIVAAVLIAVWALRLGVHIVQRTHGGEDDPRYAALQKQQGKAWPVYLFGMLQVQAAAAFVLAFAVRLAATNPAPFPNPFDIAGVALLVIAVIGEAVADAQLKQFGKTHKGGICNVGLWKWSRHPNYFFEWLGWVAWAVIAVSQPWGWLALGAPVLMYVLLVYVSGIPPLEQHMLKSRGDAFRAYQSRTSAFVPLPPKKPT